MNDVRIQNEYIVDLFLNREPDSSLRVLSLTGIRDMMEHDVDLVEAETIGCHRYFSAVIV